MRKTPLRPGPPPVRKTALRRNSPSTAFRSGLEVMAAAVQAAGEAAHRKARRAQIQRMERFGTYAWLIRVLPCAGCFPTMYKGSIALEKTVAAFAEFTGKARHRQSEPAHLKSVGAGGLADGNLLPLCAKCHRLSPLSLHNVPASEFANRIGLPLGITAKAIAATSEGKALLSIDKRAVRALRDLTVHPIGTRIWHVTGGENPAGHYVNGYLRGGGHADRSPCTCAFAMSHPAQVCKHRIAVRLYEGERLDTVLREMVAAELGI